MDHSVHMLFRLCGAFSLSCLDTFPAKAALTLNDLCTLNSRQEASDAFTCLQTLFSDARRNRIVVLSLPSEAA